MSISYRNARRFHSTTNALRDALAAIPAADRPAAIQATERQFSRQSLTIAAIGVAGWITASLVIFWSTRP